MRSDWWEHIVLGTWDDQQWLQNFLMCQATFIEIDTELCLYTEQQYIGIKPSLIPVKCITITTWKLTTSNSIPSVANLFSIGKSTAGAAVQEVCLVIQEMLLNCVIHLSNPQEMISRSCQIGFPNCWDH